RPRITDEREDRLEQYRQEEIHSLYCLGCVINFEVLQEKTYLCERFEIGSTRHPLRRKQLTPEHGGQRYDWYNNRVIWREEWN
ncbi:hypothetical protein BDFB_011500, partial [Asbolus verrucosus]